MINGVGELGIEEDTPKKEDTEAKDIPYPDCPFLLLDVRDRDAYNQCHIIGGEEAPIPQQPQLGPSFLLHLISWLASF